MSSRRIAYASKCGEDSIEQLSEKLAENLRLSIRTLGNHPVLSPEWIKMADALARIANVASMETNLPKSSEDETLWEGDALALRYVVEDGKLNLCIRLLDEYLEFEEKVDTGHRTIIFDDQKRCIQFEQGLLTILSHVWKHIEALQTTDIPLAIDVISRICHRIALDVAQFNGEEPPSSGNHVLSDISETDRRSHWRILSECIMRILHSFGRFYERLGEARILGEIQRRNLVGTVFACLAKSGNLLSDTILLKGTEGFAHIIDSEEFQMSKQEYIRQKSVLAVALSSETTENDSKHDSSASDRKLFDDVIESNEVCIDTLAKNNISSRRAIRPLLDYIALAKRVKK